MTDTSDSPELLIERRDGVVVVTLNRPKALNALTHAMVIAMGEYLRAWADDTTVTSVIVKGAGEKAFCAGGDIRKLYEARLAGQPATAFFHDEYRMNSAVHHFPKPYIAILNGVTMGGGVGISAPGRYQIATDRSLWAMPETAIGLFPDVGGSWHLPRLPGSLGRYLGLTGHRLKAADILWAGIATHHVPCERIEALIDAIVDGRCDVDTTLAAFHVDPGAAPLIERKADIDRLFAGDSVETILENLEADSSEWSDATARHLREMSPTSLKLTLAASRRGASMDFDDVLKMEYRLVCRVMESQDFVEGVRAVLVDRDQAPKWAPSSLSGVSQDVVDRYFSALVGRELDL